MVQKYLFDPERPNVRGGQRPVYDMLSSRPPDFHSYE